MSRRFLSVLVLAVAAGVCAGSGPAGAQAAEPWTAPAALEGVRVAMQLETAAAAGDADTAGAVLEALGRRPPSQADERAQHHLLLGVAQRVAGELGEAALSFLRSAVAGPPGGPLHGPALLEAAITLRALGGEEAQAAADRLLLEAEPLIVRDADSDPATLARFRTQRL